MVKVLLRGDCGWGIPQNHPGEALGTSLVPGDTDVSGEQPGGACPIPAAPQLRSVSLCLLLSGFLLFAWGFFGWWWLFGAFGAVRWGGVDCRTRVVPWYPGAPGGLSLAGLAGH